MEIEILRRSWWSYVLRGVAALIFGILFLAYPGATLKTFITLLGIFLVIDGAINIIRSIIFVFKKEPWGWTLVWGLVGLLIGLILINHTDFTLAFVAILAGIWVIILAAIGFSIGIHTADLTYADIVHRGIAMLRQNTLWIVASCALVFTVYVWVQNRVMRRSA